jgi:hypothetical protein
MLARLGSRGGGAGFCANSQFLPAFQVSCSICTLASAPSELVRRGPIVSGSKPMRANSPPIRSRWLPDWLRVSEGPWVREKDGSQPSWRRLPAALGPGRGSRRRPIPAGLVLIAADGCTGTANMLEKIPPNGDSNLDRYEQK